MKLFFSSAGEGYGSWNPHSSQIYLSTKIKYVASKRNMNFEEQEPEPPLLSLEWVHLKSLTIIVFRKNKYVILKSAAKAFQWCTGRSFVLSLSGKVTP